MPGSNPIAESSGQKRQALDDMFEIGRHPLVLQHVETEERDGYTLETLSFATRTGEAVRGYLTRPRHMTAPLPAILYIHAHGGRYDIGADELVSGRPALLSPLASVFAENGYVTLTIDLPCFGTRQQMTESALTKALLWHGHSLAGQMLGELHSALDYLAARPDVDAAHIGAFGISMGATFSYWLAAVDPRLKALAHLCCYADFDTMIETGAHEGHGIYLTVPGLLDLAGNGEIAGLSAPRPQFIGLGAKDPLTPPEAVARALVDTRAAYTAAGAEQNLEIMIEPDSGHEETPAIRAAVLAFFARHLRDASRAS